MYLPGGLILDHCNNDRRTNLMVSDIYSGYLAENDVDQAKILSWLTDNTKSTVEAAELLDPLGKTVIFHALITDDKGTHCSHTQFISFLNYLTL